MSNQMFVLALAAGAGFLAVWIHARFPGLAPERMGKRMLHTGVAFVLLKLTPGVGDSALAVVARVFPDRARRLALARRRVWWTADEGV